MLLPSSHSPLLTKQGIDISSRGENVVLRLGNVDLPMHYEHALALSAWIRDEARRIKFLCGRPKTMRSLGTLIDANAKDSPLPYQPGTAIHVKDKLADWHRGDVTTEGRLICIKIGSKVMKLHFESALKIGQWLRVRAKEARNRAGDTRHWSEISSLADLTT